MLDLNANSSLIHVGIDEQIKNNFTLEIYKFEKDPTLKIIFNREGYYQAEITKMLKLKFKVTPIFRFFNSNRILNNLKHKLSRHKNWLAKSF